MSNIAGRFLHCIWPAHGKTVHSFSTLTSTVFPSERFSQAVTYKKLSLEGFSYPRVQLVPWSKGIVEEGRKEGKTVPYSNLIQYYTVLNIESYRGARGSHLISRETSYKSTTRRPGPLQQNDSVFRSTISAPLAACPHAMCLLGIADFKSLCFTTAGPALLPTSATLRPVRDGASTCCKCFTPRRSAFSLL